MRKIALSTLAAAALLVAAGSADAATCRSRVEGQGTGQGLAGIGTDNAKSAATIAWQANARKAYGHRFADFGKAQNVRMNCASGAIFQAKCVVTARPCR